MPMYALYPNKILQSSLKSVLWVERLPITSEKGTEIDKENSHT